MAQSEIRIAPWPADHLNPYQRLFYEALAPYGARVVPGLTVNDDALRSFLGRIDIVHLHWPEYAWRVGGKGYAAQVRRIVGLGRFLKLARRSGVTVWWTAHNLVPHEGNPLVNFLGYRTVASYSDLVIAHSETAASRVERRYGTRGVVVVRQGAYPEVYVATSSREEVIRRVGLDPAKPIFVCLGAVRRYKGVMTAIEAVERLGGRVQLLIAGDPKNNPDVPAIEARVHRTSWTRAILRWVDDHDFANYMAASDGVLLPYRQGTTSAVLLTAWTMQRGVVASDLACFRDEIIRHPGAGVIARSPDAAGFAAAIEEYLKMPVKQRTAAAAAAAANYRWSECVLPLVDRLGCGARV